MVGTYNFKLITILILMSFIAVFFTFSIIKRLFISDKKNRIQLFLLSALLVSVGLWGLHFIELLAFPLSLISTGYFINYIVFSWLTAYITSFSIIYVSSQKKLPLSSLLFGSCLAGLGGFGVFYFNVKSLKIATSFTFIPNVSALCILAAIAVAMLTILVFFWLKSDSGSHRTYTRILFSIIVSLAMIGIQITYNNAVFV